MFNIFPNTYVIVAVLLIAIYFHSVFTKWKQLEYVTIDIRRIREYRILAARAKFTFILFLLLGIALAAIDLEASRYILE